MLCGHLVSLVGTVRELLPKVEGAHFADALAGAI